MRLAAAVAVALACTVEFATIDARADWSEAINGDFSSVNTAPTPVPVASGSNLITGQVGTNSNNGQIDDYFMITVPAGQRLSSIVLTSDAPSSGSGDLTFFAVASGSSISASNSSASGMLGWAHFGTSNVGTNLLPAMSTSGNGATDFTPPLPAGTYSFRIQDNTGGNNTPYQLNLVLSPTPAPAMPGAALGGLVLLLGVAGGAALRGKKGLRPAQ
jgi:hypothetical protein